MPEGVCSTVPRRAVMASRRPVSPSAAVAEMERLMRLHDDVMRVMTIKVDEHEEGDSAIIRAKNARDERGRGRDRGPREDRPRRDDRGFR